MTKGAAPFSQAKREARLRGSRYSLDDESGPPRSN
jgi:hypothetical protein